MNDVWDSNLTKEVKSKDSVGMRKALSSIAQELQSLCTQDTIEIYSTPPEVKSDEILEKLNMIRLKLSSKNRQMKKLRKNFKTACVVARSAISSKDDETAYLFNHMQLTKKQCECLLQKNRHDSQVIKDLQSKKQFLKDEMESIKNFIDLGYKELQKMRNIPYQNISIMHKLREIMICCGQYYSDYYNEQQKRQRLEQRNSYLTHKLSLLKNNIEAISEDLNYMRTQKLRLQAVNESLKRKQRNARTISDINEIEVKRSVCNYDNKVESKLSSDDAKYGNKTINLNFNLHLTLIKKLLNDQDDMLKYLKQISDELTIEGHCSQSIE